MKATSQNFQLNAFRSTPACGKTTATILRQAMFLAATFLFPAAAMAWDLPQCMGNQKDGWATVENNWTEQSGNPYTVEGGGVWTLAIQNSKSPATTDDYTPLENTVLFNFIKGWGSPAPSLDSAGTPMVIYFGEGTDGRKLCVATNADYGFPQQAIAAAILFKVPKDGKYQVAIEGKVTLQSKTAGWTSVQIYSLSGGRKVENPIKTFQLNAPDGAHPGEVASLNNQLSYSDAVTLKAGDEIVTRMQTVSPGMAPAGSSAVVFSKYSIVPVAAAPAAAASTATK